jgi:hypothetical protein
MAIPNNGNNNAAGAIPVYLVAAGTPKNITTSTTTLVKTGPGSIYGLTVNTGGTTSTAKLYDGIDATGTLIATCATTATGASFTYNIAFAAGLCIVTAGGAPADVTVSYA